MVITKGIELRLDPTKAQKIYFNKCIGAERVAYNAMLRARFVFITHINSPFSAVSYTALGYIQIIPFERRKINNHFLCEAFSVFTMPLTAQTFFKPRERRLFDSRNVRA